MRIFLKLDNNNVVVNELRSTRIPGDGPGLPSGVMEATGRNDGPWLGKVYDPATDTFSPFVEPVTKGKLEVVKLPLSYQVWQMWKQTRLEAQARGAGAALVTALTNREDAAWTAYVNDLQEWRQAS